MRDIDIRSSQKEIRQELQANIHRKRELALCLMESHIGADATPLSNRGSAGHKADLQKTIVEDTQSELTFMSDRSTQRGSRSVVGKIERRHE